MMRTILVDDEQRGINSLRKMLEQHAADVEIVAECLDANSAKEKFFQCTPDLVFLDISMPGKSAFDLLNEMEVINFEIIFVTAHNDYIMQAFKYSAVDYLMKPVDEDLLSDAIRRASRRINQNDTSRNVNTLIYNLQKLQTPHEMKLCIPSLKGFQVINLADVIYCEAVSSYTIFHLVDNHQIMASRSMIEYELLLDNSTFCRIHKSFLVNLVHIKEYQKGEGGTVILTNNKEVEVSRRKKEIFISRMKELYKF